MQNQDEIDKLKREISELQKENLSLRESDTVLNYLSTSFAALTATEFFQQITTHLAVNINVDYAFVGELLPDGNNVNVLCGYAMGQTMPSFSYRLSDTPCENVIGKKTCFYPKDVQHLFPDDILLQQMNIEGYIGTPLFDTTGNAIGIIVLLSTKPLEQIELLTTLLNIFSGRCGVEIERMRFEKAYLESELKYRTLVESVNDGIFILRDAKLEYVNPAFNKILGYENEELKDFYFPDFIAPEDKDMVLDYYHRRLKGDKTVPTTYTVTLIKKDGDLLKIIIKANLTDFSGSKFIIGTATDITEQYNLERENFELERRLLQTQKLESIGVLTGGIAHNFNNLLMAIIGNIDLAMLRMSHIQSEFSLLNNAMESAMKAAELTSKMLAYSGKGNLRIDSINLNDIIKHNINLIRSSITKLIEINVEYADNMPEINADTEQIDQITMNLVINSAEAIGENKGIITIKTGVISCDTEYLKNSRLDINPPPGDFAFIEVADTGCGMSDETIQKLFVPFYSTKFLGRGLGMPAIMGIIKLHKGAILIDSEVNNGTTIRVLLPCKPGEKKVNSSFNNDLLLEKDVNYDKKNRFLIVDDNNDVRIICTSIIESFGYKTIPAENGLKAVELYKIHQDEICCVILDLSMPEMDGVEALQKIKEISPDAHIIISSGYNEKEVISQFTNYKPSGFIQKPYEIKKLKKLINKVLNI